MHNVLVSKALKQQLLICHYHLTQNTTGQE